MFPQELSLKKIFFFFLAVLGLCCYEGSSLVAVSGSYSQVVAQRLLTAAASRCRARALGTQASVVAMHRLSCPLACGIFPDQGSNPCTLYGQVNS